jgi:hypothetical protein
MTSCVLFCLLPVYCTGFYVALHDDHKYKTGQFTIHKLKKKEESKTESRVAYLQK